MQVSITDAVIRELAHDVGLDVGGRGRLSDGELAEFSSYVQMPLTQTVTWLETRLAESERAIRGLEAERSEDRAVIRSLQKTIDGLERDLDLAYRQRDDWRGHAISLATAYHSAD
jgi:hypothetical protein